MLQDRFFGRTLCRLAGSLMDLGEGKKELEGRRKNKMMRKEYGEGRN